MSRGRLLLIALIVLAIIAFILLALCRPKASEDEVKATATATATSGAKASATTAPKSAATTAPAAGTAAAKAGATSNELAAALDAFKKAEFKVTYEMSGAGFPAGATMVISQSGGKSRTEFSLSGQTMTIISAPAPDKSYMCIAEQRMCIDAAGAGAFGAAFSNPVAAGMQAFGSASPTGLRPVAGRTIAGVAARCFEGTDVTQGSGTVCVGPEGQLLAIDGASPQGTFKLTATKVEGKPAAADFNPPYPVTAMPSIPGGIPGGIPTGPPRP